MSDSTNSNELSNDSKMILDINTENSTQSNSVDIDIILASQMFRMFDASYIVLEEVKKLVGVNKLEVIYDHKNFIIFETQISDLTINEEIIFLDGSSLIQKLAYQDNFITSEEMQDGSIIKRSLSQEGIRLLIPLPKVKEPRFFTDLMAAAEVAHLRKFPQTTFWVSLTTMEANSRPDTKLDKSPNVAVEIMESFNFYQTILDTSGLPLIPRIIKIARNLKQPMGSLTSVSSWESAKINFLDDIQRARVMISEKLKNQTSQNNIIDSNEEF